MTGDMSAADQAGRPDLSLLDEKQQEVMVKWRRSAGDGFPGLVRRTLGRTIDVLEARRTGLERASV